MNIDDLLNQPGVTVTFDDWEREADVKLCPTCGYGTRIWYVTVMDADGNYLASLHCRKCLRCEYQAYYEPGGE